MWSSGYRPIPGRPERLVELPAESLFSSRCHGTKNWTLILIDRVGRILLHDQSGTAPTITSVHYVIYWALSSLERLFRAKDSSHATFTFNL